MAVKVLSKILDKLRIFKAEDQVRDGHLINAMEIITFISAMYMGAELYKNSIDKYFTIVSPGIWLSMVGQGPKGPGGFWDNWFGGEEGEEGEEGSGEAPKVPWRDSDGDLNLTPGVTGGVNEAGEWVPPNPLVPPAIQTPLMISQTKTVKRRWRKFLNWVKGKRKK